MARGSRKTTLTITHTEENKGQTAYCPCCYEHSKGGIRAWPLVVEGIIG